MCEREIWKGEKEGKREEEIVREREREREREGESQPPSNYLSQSGDKSVKYFLLFLPKTFFPQFVQFWLRTGLIWLQIMIMLFGKCDDRKRTTAILKIINLSSLQFREMAWDVFGLKSLPTHGWLVESKFLLCSAFGITNYLVQQRQRPQSSLTDWLPLPLSLKRHLGMFFQKKIFPRAIE